MQLSSLPIPKVSILMTIYNRDFFKIKRAMDSVFAQDFTDFEFIIIDDGCSESLSKEILTYAINKQEQTTYIRHKNRGQAFSINQAIINSRGDYIGFIDSDDEYKKNHISECLKQINEKCDLIASLTETKVMKEDDYFIPDKNHSDVNIHVDNCIVFGTLFGKRHVFLNIGFNDVYSLDSDFYEKASNVYRTKKLDLKTYIYYLGEMGSIITETKRKRKNKK